MSGVQLEGNKARQGMRSVERKINRLQGLIKRLIVRFSALKKMSWKDRGDVRDGDMEELKV